MSYKYKDKEILTPMTPFFEKAAKELESNSKQKKPDY
jgi:hypothetical protein